MRCNREHDVGVLIKLLGCHSERSEESRTYLMQRLGDSSSFSPAPDGPATAGLLRTTLEEVLQQPPKRQIRWNSD